MTMNKIPEIVLTGGPCGGKTTALSYIPEKLRDYGFRVFVIPEVATMLINGGLPDIALIAKDPKKNYEVEKHFLLFQRTLRERYNALSRTFTNKKCVILSDRAEMDIEHYIGKEYFNALLSELRLNLCDARDSYEGILHLTSAACGAEKFYTLTNNKARRETLKEARIADKKTMGAWIGHPHLKIIDNSTGFESKLKRALQAITRILGIPVPLEIERKFLLNSAPDFKSDKNLAHAQEITIEQIYLISPKKNEEIRIRKRSQGNSHIYYRTVKIPIASGERQEKEETISAREYLDLQTLRDPKKKTIKKRRYCFIHKSQYFELDVIEEPKKICLLEIELTERNDRVEIPPFLNIAKEVTDDKGYSNFYIASTK